MHDENAVDDPALYVKGVSYIDYCAYCTSSLAAKVVTFTFQSSRGTRWHVAPEQAHHESNHHKPCTITQWRRPKEPRVTI